MGNGARAAQKRERNAGKDKKEPSSQLKTVSSHPDQFPFGSNVLLSVIFLFLWLAFLALRRAFPAYKWLRRLLLPNLSQAKVGVVIGFVGSTIYLGRSMRDLKICSLWW